MQTLHRKFKKAASTRRGRIIALSVLLLIFLVIAGGLLYWNIYRKQIIRNELEKIVRNKGNGLYKLTYDSLKLDEVAGNLAISGIKLVHDSLHYAGLLSKNDAPPTLVKISIPSISVTGVQTPRALMSREIVGKKLTINQPVIDIIYTDAGKDSARYVPTQEVYKQVLGELGMIKIDTLEIIGAEIATSKITRPKKIVQFTNVSIRLIHVAIDEETAANSNQILFAKQLFFEANKITFPSQDQPYLYTIDSISLNSAARAGFAKRFRITPLLKEDAFVKSLPAQDDRFDFSFAGIKMRNLDIRGLFNENVIADSFLIGSASFKIYRDLSIPRDKKSRVGRYPHQLLDKVPLSIQVKKMILSNAFVEYKEKNKITGQSGKVRFHNVFANVANLTNNKDAIKENNVMTADISARFLDKAPLTLAWKFYLRHSKGRFDIKGNLGGIAAEEVSPLTEPMGPVKMEDGQIKSLDFRFEGNDYGTDGTVRMLYDDLKLSLLEKDEGSKELDRKSLASFVANIVVKNDNPAKEKDEPRVSTIHHGRDTNRSIFHLVWKSIFKGVKETVGIKK